MHGLSRSSSDEVPPKGGLPRATKPLLVVAGEASGDLHGGEILKALKTLNPSLRVIGIGGARMAPYLDRQLADVRELGVVGFVEVLKHLPALLRLKKAILAAAREEGIGTVLFIDYPGFNLSMAKTFRKQLPEVRLHQYVCPQVWAWRAGRIPVLGNTLDTLYCLFDFEPALFAGFPVEALWLGHPLVEVVKPEVDRDTFFRETGLDPGRPLVALLPGSRRGEIQGLLPAMAQLAKIWSRDPGRRGVQWALSVAPTVASEEVTELLAGAPITLIAHRTYALCTHASAALVCSGTATLETALLGTPFAILYKLNPLTYFLARLLVKVPYFGLANIVAGRSVVMELLQGEVNPERLSLELESLLEAETSARMRRDLAEIRGHLGEAGAAVRVAEHLFRAMG